MRINKRYDLRVEMSHLEMIECLVGCAVYERQTGGNAEVLLEEDVTEEALEELPSDMDGADEPAAASAIDEADESAEVDESEPEAVEENPAEEMPPDAPEPKKANRPSIMVADVFELEVAPEAIAIVKACHHRPQ